MIDPLIGMTFDVSSMLASSGRRGDDGSAPRGGNGSQVLPVADLPDDFDGVPEDGMQYLFTVRQEARKRPSINRVPNPYQVIAQTPSPAPATPRVRQVGRPTQAWRSSFVTQFLQLRQRIAAAPALSSFPPMTHNPLPQPQDQGAWHLFIHGRKTAQTSDAAKRSSSSSTASLSTRIPTAPPPAAATQSTTTDVDMTPAESEAAESLQAAKSQLLASLELDAPSASELPDPEEDSTEVPSHPPHYPTPSLLLSIPAYYIPRLLFHFQYWLATKQEDYEMAINYTTSTIFAPSSLRRKPTTSTQPMTAVPVKTIPRPPLMTAHELHWLLSLLTRLDTLLDGEDISTLRSLVRTIKLSNEKSELARREREEVRKAPRRIEEKREDEDEAERRGFGWMIVAVVCGEVWGQRDLWDE
ncbi:BZ3500_MvSof-1268-A1-R1_Chr2-1g04271 [Microbotryum saponariae]|uniref:BZ3500_MvSof-1268-A1-R1_Chr2-1g04271 protein n=1 Tax=Microbotryum saponariae TaxID=289078 RepID=A0A2X0MAY2_9BASI|nr:BZ3500_MvSof-1268-A1-R1_Chr2-1g04271 [Microbotryum saponariae]SCZ91280.1 BZ3501_MvSof-1269-A2-R1_Chr2-1g03927 [Microbotryum saponariae]